jgi:AcrR family transcriptional regulator
MPPGVRIPRDRILDAAFQIAREAGAENINARTVSEKLGCSTQPVMYHFKKIEALKQAVYHAADAYHSAYITDVQGDNPMKEIGLRYIRFAAEEKNLFRFLFQSDGLGGKNLSELIDGEALQPVITLLSQAAQIDLRQAKRAFRSLFLTAHGYASMLANNEMAFDEKTVGMDLTLIFDGVLCALKGECE